MRGGSEGGGGARVAGANPVSIDTTGPDQSLGPGPFRHQPCRASEVLACRAARPRYNLGRVTRRDPFLAQPALVGAALAAIYVLGALPQLGTYGPTWDLVLGEYPFGERLLGYLESGDARFLELGATEPAPWVRQPHPDFAVGRFAGHQVYPLAALLSALSCRVFWGLLGWLPAMSAHHLPVLLLAALLVWGMVATVGRRFGLVAGVGSALLLLGSPRFFAHAMHNLKDAPTACLYTAAVALGYAALTRRRWWWWGAAGACTGLALACKANALFVPVQLGLLWTGCQLLPRLRAERRVTLSPVGLALAAGACVAAWLLVSPRLWPDPLAGALAWLREVFRVGNTAFSATGPRQVAVSLDGPLQVLITTPLPLLGLALIGLGSRRLRAEQRLWLLLAIAVPVGRTALPGMRNFDGVRHFLEFLPALAMAGGVGLAGVAALPRRLAGDAGRLPRVLGGGLAAALVLPGLLATARTHPNGIAFHNALVGGLAGAQARGLHGATDYWGNSYWQGLAWLAENAPQGAQVLVPLAPHIARSAAPVRLRADLRLLDERQPLPGEVFVMYITRREWFTPFLAALDGAVPPVHEILVQGAPILRILRLPDGSDGHRLWQRQLDAEAALLQLMVWIGQHPGRRDEFLALTAGLGGPNHARVADGLRALFPAELHGALEQAIWLRQPPR